MLTNMADARDRLPLLGRLFENLFTFSELGFLDHPISRILMLASVRVTKPA